MMKKYKSRADAAARAFEAHLASASVPQSINEYNPQQMYMQFQ